ncbi:MAG TPA: arylesterase [Leptospiraceae bacterium]|nr:arylesterase [Leptospiraceae bacterium]HMW04268.1 arylesterase [Leptospiraceae bacterium]HMX30614.1 arylesterase [Leptospiraceae bacterium]HMY31314.1 arylesterase [Leptospiraceae bacterium]HMZ63427.1 arylesterase [Leptospiraceae bacterium]
MVTSCNKQDSNPTAEMKPDNRKKIIFFGDSLTAGMGLLNPDESFVARIAVKLKEDGFDLKVINAGLSGDTTSGGLARLDWSISKGVDYFVLELGANDGMRGIETELIESNLKKIISKVREKNPNVKILLVRMLTFPNLGPAYVKKFNAIYPKVAKEEKIPLSAFLLEKVAGIKELNQKDGIHPTGEGHQLLAETLYPSVRKLVE